MIARLAHLKVAPPFPSCPLSARPANLSSPCLRCLYLLSLPKEHWFSQGLQRSVNSSFRLLHFGLQRLRNGDGARPRLRRKKAGRRGYKCGVVRQITSAGHRRSWCPEDCQATRTVAQHLTAASRAGASPHLASRLAQSARRSQRTVCETSGWLRRHRGQISSAYNRPCRSEGHGEVALLNRPGVAPYEAQA